MNRNRDKEKLILFDLKNFRRLQVIPFESEREDVANFFKENMSRIFPNLKWIKDEYTFKKKDSRDDGFRVDAIGFWEKSRKGKKIIVLFEYKKKAAKGLIEQSKSYINLLTKKSWESEKDKDSLIRLINDNLKKKKDFEHLYKDDISWEESKIICVAPEFHPHQIESIEDGEEREKIILIKVIKYVGEILSMEIVGGKLPEWLNITFSKSTETKNNKAKVQKKTEKIEREDEVIKSALSIDEIIKNAELKEISQKISNLPFLKKLSQKIRPNEKTPYYAIDFLIAKKVSFSMVITENWARVYGNFKSSSEIPRNLVELLNKYYVKYEEKGNWGGGKSYWNFPKIENDSDFRKLKLKDFFQEYKEKFPENSEVFQ